MGTSVSNSAWVLRILTQVFILMKQALNPLYRVLLSIQPGASLERYETSFT
ncbi:hypothetical protein STEG23_006088, partial [Scotinomys teguina]